MGWAATCRASPTTQAPPLPRSDSEPARRTVARLAFDDHLRHAVGPRGDARLLHGERLEQDVGQALLRATNQSDHQATRPSGHQAIRPSSHQAIRPSSHQAIRTLGKPSYKQPGRANGETERPIKSIKSATQSGHQINQAHQPGNQINQAIGRTISIPSATHLARRRERDNVAPLEDVEGLLRKVEDGRVLLEL